MTDKKFIQSSEVRLGNCLDVMSEYMGGQVNMVLTSPPYWVQRECAEEGAYPRIEDYFADMERIFDECYRIAAPGCIFAINIGGDPTFDLRSWLSMMLQRKNLLYVDCIAWTKSSGNVVRGFHVNTHNRYYPFISWEPVFIYRKNPNRGNVEDENFPRFEERFKDLINNILRNNVWHIPMDNEAPWHPAPFPRKLAYNLVAVYTEPKAIILDPFAGAMTTAVAVNEVGGGRRYLCVELDPLRYDKGLERIRKSSQETFAL